MNANTFYPSRVRAPPLHLVVSFFVDGGDVWHANLFSPALLYATTPPTWAELYTHNPVIFLFLHRIGFRGIFFFFVFFFFFVTGRYEEKGELRFTGRWCHIKITISQKWRYEHYVYGGNSSFISVYYFKDNKKTNTTCTMQLCIDICTNNMGIFLQMDISRKIVSLLTYYKIFYIIPFWV